MHLGEQLDTLVCDNVKANSSQINLCLLICSIPPLSVVGLSEEQAVEQANGDLLVFTSSFNPMKNTVSGYVQHYEAPLYALGVPKICYIWT